MSVNGIGNSIGVLRPPFGEPRNRVEGDRSGPGGTVPAGAAGVAAAQRGPLSTAAPRAALPAEAPSGTDPELWAVLTVDERAFFAKVGAMGPLTYGHLLTAQATSTPISRGGRLDVRA